MTGRHNGLGVKLKQLNNILIQVHCVAHRLNLAASQASKDIDYLERYKGQINSIYKFYSNSDVRYDKLREIQQLMHEKVKRVVEPSSVRWLSVKVCVKMIFECFDSLVMSLENEKSSNATAVGIWQFAASAQFLLITVVLIDVLSIIGTLSLLFQMDIANLSVIKHIMHDKFGVLALSERWIQCICKKGIMLNKPRAVNFFKGSNNKKCSDSHSLHAFNMAAHWKVCSENYENRRKQSKSDAMQISIIASFKKQAKDKQEQSTHSECDPLDNNECFDLDNSASATNLDNVEYYDNLCDEPELSPCNRDQEMSEIDVDITPETVDDDS
ncbi:hypothetical protein pdam_00025373 [Pocillopora damicornis]|uniref:DUF4371 domain-containing protein n=1 Tax=Pocillopora damicornis TaxID=46731 RepID=A0A3M6U0J3_POCDA|nr:hypothetical protein pdam_00025373 [Pocillopora damicornis]